MQLSIGQSTKRCSSLRYILQIKGKSLLRMGGLLHMEKLRLVSKGSFAAAVDRGRYLGSLSCLLMLLFSLPTPCLGLRILAVG